MTRLDRLYGAHSEAADAGGQRLFVAPQLTIHFLLLNTTGRRSTTPAPPGRQLRHRPAGDRRRAVPRTTGRPTDQILPPGLPGFADEPIYPLGGPDLDRARQLAGAARRPRRPLHLRSAGVPELGETVRDNLEPIGIDLDVRDFPIPEMFERIAHLG